MPSPVGHTLAGITGFLVVRRDVPERERTAIFIASIFLATAADWDVVPGLLLTGHPGSLHHQAAHSVTAAVLVGFLVAVVAHLQGRPTVKWGVWGAAVYFSHPVLDILVDDPTPPLGVQILWPFSQSYFISPLTPFPRFDYFDPAVGVIPSLLSPNNVWTVLYELDVLVPVAALAWYFTRSRGVV